jgi:preprotein translocase subunit YajC
MGMLPIILMFVILYFLMIRPQMKKAKEHSTMSTRCRRATRSIAVGHPRQDLQDQRQLLTWRVAPNVTIQVQKQAVTTLLPKGTIKDAQ